MIQLKGIRKHFKTAAGTIRAVDDIDLTVEPGEIFGIIGYSGAGKSTLIRTINLLEPPTAGEVRVGERVFTQLSGRELREARREIGMIFQQFHLLWSRTVKENVRFPLEIAGVEKAEADKKVRRMLELVGLTDKADAYPAQLSGGQKQRVGIARALANDPKVLLCDEATSALDPKTTDDILRLLQKINRELNLTIVLITHEMHVIRKICHRVAVMENGRFVESGPVSDVFRRPKKEITRRFVRDVAGLEEEAKEALDLSFSDLSSGRVLKCTFFGTEAKQPVISRCIRACDVDLSILQGQVRQVNDTAYGTLYVHVDGSQEQVARVVDFLRGADVEVEVLDSGPPPA